MKNSNMKNKKGSSDAEKGLLGRFQTETKNTIFGVLFVLLKEEDSSIIVTIIVHFFLFLQLLIFPFNEHVTIFHSQIPRLARPQKFPIGSKELL